MGMSTHVFGFKPPGQKWLEMKAVWEACETAGVTLPEAVVTYFNGAKPDEAGVEVSQAELVRAGALKPYETEMAEGFDLDVTKLPRDVTVVRFYNAY